MRNKIISLLLLAVMCLPFPVWAEEATEAADKKLSFNDVSETHYAYEAVSKLVEMGVINGRDEKHFAPDENLKREEFSKILVNAFGLTDTNNAPVYSDVPARTWYADFVAKVSVSGYMQGVSDSTFGTGMTLSRQDLAVILKRYLDKEKVVLESDSSVIYADIEETADYAKVAVNVLSANGVMPGKENNLWLPLANVTRADTAVAVYNALNKRREYASSLGRMGPSSQYELPHEMTFNDRLSEVVPTPFDPEISPRREIVYEDFNDEDFGVLYKRSGFNANVTIDETAGVDGSGCLKIEGDASKVIYPMLAYDAKNGEFREGDYLALTAKIRTENLSGSGAFMGLVSMYNDQGKWLNESWGSQKNEMKEWQEITWLQGIPETPNELNPPEYYTAGLGAYVRNLDGTFYFDDFRLSVIVTDPMETILMTPNYKGIIKGDDGVGDIALRANISDKNGKYDLSKFKLTSQITDNDHNVLVKTECDKVTNVMDVYLSSASLPMGGDFQLETILTDKETGEQIQKSEWPLHKREKDFTTKIGYDKYGRVLKNGEPVFPVSTYNHGTYEDAIPDFIEAGSIDVYMHSGLGWYLNWGTNERYRELIGDLDKNGMDISLAFGGVFMDTATAEVKDSINNQEDLRAYLTKIVKNFRDFPNLFGYYLYDEINNVRYGEEMAWARKIIEQLDLDHPTICAIDNPYATSPGVTAKTSDFLGYDPYPVTGKPDQNISLVYDRITEGKKLNPNRPVYTILQGFKYTHRGDLRAPTEEEFRNMVFQAIVAGSCMLDMYAYRDLKDATHTESTWREYWESYTGVFEEVQYLEPILISVLPAPYYEVRGGEDWLKTMTRRYDGKSYLFAVNNEPSDEVARFYLDGVTEIQGMYSGETYVADSNGWFEVDMDAYRVEVFEYAQDDYKSPHAELTRFGLSGCVTNDVDKTPCFVVSSDKNEVEYNAAISDYAKLYINGEEKETIGKIDVSNLSEITVKVVSEDGRFETEKVYKVERK